MAESLAALLTGFDCVADEYSEILILGSMPGVRSLQQQEYYAHPRNAFWKIIQAHFAIPCDADYTSRLTQLLDNKIALWDVAYQCEREGSLDSNIKPQSVQVNDFKALFEYSPNIKRVFFNGGKAADLYKRKVINELDETASFINYYQLPSTSPANARLNLDQKIAVWEQIRT